MKWTQSVKEKEAVLTQQHYFSSDWFYEWVLNIFNVEQQWIKREKSVCCLHRGRVSFVCTPKEKNKPEISWKHVTASSVRAGRCDQLSCAPCCSLLFCDVSLVLKHHNQGSWLYQNAVSVTVSKASRVEFIEGPKMRSLLMWGSFINGGGKY